MAVKAESAAELVSRPANDRATATSGGVAPDGRPLRRTDRPLRANRPQQPTDPTEPIRLVPGQLDETPDTGGIRLGNPD